MKCPLPLRSLLAQYVHWALACWAYSFQTFSAGEVLGASKMNQIEVNIRDHAHGASGVSSDISNLIASQADQETGTSTTTIVTPGRQHFHPSAIKAAVRFNSAGTIAYNYNITSITDNGTGDWSINIATDFSAAANYAAVALIGQTTGNVCIAQVGVASAAGVFRLYSRNLSVAFADPDAPDEIHVIFTGDQ